jgi:gluconate kinase
MRERESKKEGRMTWMSVGAGIMTSRCLEEKKKFLSPSAFNLYYRFSIIQSCKNIVFDYLVCRLSLTHKKEKRKE